MDYFRKNVLNNDNDDIFFNQRVVDYVSKVVSQKIHDELNIRMIVTDRVIIGVLNQFFFNYKPFASGDMYSKYNIEIDSINGYDDIIQRSINFIFKNIEVNVMEDKIHSSLSIWDSNRQDWNERPKIREKTLQKFNWQSLESLGNNIPEMG